MDWVFTRGVTGTEKVEGGGYFNILKRIKDKRSVIPIYFLSGSPPPSSSIYDDCLKIHSHYLNFFLVEKNVGKFVQLFQMLRTLHFEKKKAIVFFFVDGLQNHPQV